LKPQPLPDALDEAHFGGKAASLARALRAGLPVPPGFALSTTHVDAIVEGDSDALKQLRNEFTRLARPCAVRSSAIGEDSNAASFAGQHVTILNVGALGIGPRLPADARGRRNAAGRRSRAAND
jgi:pyruvate,water dikinase